MFAIARQALVGMAQFIPGFPVSNPNKFCHGYGMFQLDLQFFKDDPDYFLEKRYEKFSETLARCIGELTVKAKKIGLFNKPSLSDMELTAVAIAYNTGNFIPSKGLMQGFFDGQKFYGQHIFEFIRMAHTVAVPGGRCCRHRRQAAPSCRPRRRWRRPGRSSLSTPSSARCACAARRRSVRLPPPT